MDSQNLPGIEPELEIVVRKVKMHFLTKHHVTVRITNAVRIADSISGFMSYF